MPTLETLPPGPPKIILYGKAGSGKTTWAMSLGAKLELICTDPLGYEVGRHHKDEFTDARKKVEITYCPEPDPVNSAKAWVTLKNRVITINNEIVSKKYKQKVVAFDSLTTMGEAALRYVRSNSGKLLDSKQITQPEWGIAMEEVNQVMTISRSWPIPVIWIAHEQSETEDSGAVSRTVSIIGNKLLPKIIANTEEIYYVKVISLAAGKQDFVIQTVRTPGIEVKTRRGAPDNFSISKGADAFFKTINYDLEISHV